MAQTELEVIYMENIENITGNDGAVETTPTSGAEEIKTYTQEEVMALLQKESDRRVNQALEKERKKHAKELSLSRLDDEARAQAEKDNRIAELEEMVAQMKIAENRSELKSVLSSRGLSAEFADIITINDDLETSQANIDKLDKLFKSAVRAEVERRLAGNTPKGNGASPAEITKESAKKMSMAELSALEKTNPELFNKLFN